jgi:hypothetical protein
MITPRFAACRLAARFQALSKPALLTLSFASVRHTVLESSGCTAAYFDDSITKPLAYATWPVVKKLQGWTQGWLNTTCSPSIERRKNNHNFHLKLSCQKLQHTDCARTTKGAWQTTQAGISRGVSYAVSNRLSGCT